MADKNRNHWQSLAADLTGKPATEATEKVEELDSNTDEVDASEAKRPPTADHSNEDSDPQVQKVDPPIETEVAEPVDEEPASRPAKNKKKKSGGWAFWRSRPKDEPESSEEVVQTDPLTMLKSAETTDDVVSAIDRLFAVDSTQDTRQDEIVFDEADIEDSISFTESERAAEEERSEKPPRSRRGGRGRSRGSRSSGSDDRQNGDRRTRSRSDDGNRRQSDSDRGGESSSRDRQDGRDSDDGRVRQRSPRRSSSRSQSDSSDDQSRRRGDSDRERKQEDIPSWETAVCYVVDKNMTTRNGAAGKTKGKSKSNSRRRRKEN